MTPLLALLSAAPLKVASPDGALVAALTLDGGAPRLALAYRGRPLLAPGRLGLDLAAGGPLQGGLALVAVRRSSADRTHPLPFGKASVARDRYRGLAATFLETAGRHRRLEILLRAYDEGLALRYRVPTQVSLPLSGEGGKGGGGSAFRIALEARNRRTDALGADFRSPSDARPPRPRGGSEPNRTDKPTPYDVREELTEFRPVGAPEASPFKATALVLPNERTPYEEPYQTGPLRDGTLIGFPLLLQRPDGIALAFTEADLDDFPGLYLRPDRGTLRAHLSPRLDGSGLAARKTGPFQTPWRVVMVGDPKRLLESNLVFNLNPPSVLKDTSWIKPGKTTFPWWNGYDTGATGLKPAQTTAYHEWCIDFCARHGFPYHSLDGLDNVAWYGGPIVPYGGGPLTKGLPGLDLEAVVRYARAKGVRIRLWMSSAAARAQMDVAYPYYRKIGIEGVMVDFFDRDDQDTVNLVRRVVRTAAENRLTVTLHNLYKPTGLQRTYPNLLAFEAARNLEYDKWDPVGITPEHEMDVAFVRALAGPIDFHAGSFRNVLAKDYRPVDKAPVTIGTRARQLARYVVFEDPLNMVADSPAVYEASPAGLTFLAEVPTVWDETRVLAGEVGRYLVVARRKGRVWYVGGMTDSVPRTLKLPLTFLPKGPYRYELWTDAPGAPTNLALRKGSVDRTRPLPLSMRPAGGFALRLTPGM